MMLAILRICVALVGAVVLTLIHIVKVLIGSVGYVYLLPGVIAMRRNYPGTDKVFIFCVLMNWTVIGWFAALAFALTRPDGSEESIIAAH